jgi:hypothetical protein
MNTALTATNNALANGVFYFILASKCCYAQKFSFNAFDDFFIRRNGPGPQCYDI